MPYNGRCKSGSHCVGCDRNRGRCCKCGAEWVAQPEVTYTNSNGVTWYYNTNMYEQKRYDLVLEEPSNEFEDDGSEENIDK